MRWGRRDVRGAGREGGKSAGGEITRRQRDTCNLHSGCFLQFPLESKTNQSEFSFV